MFESYISENKNSGKFLLGPSLKMEFLLNSIFFVYQSLNLPLIIKFTQ